MDSLQFHCPLCTGLFEVDAAYSGMEVSCPHCQQGVTVPAWQPSQPPVAAPPAATELQLSCPLCQGFFVTSSDMAGQQVLCPHCQQAVSVPSFTDAAPYAPVPAPSPPPVFSPPPQLAPPPPIAPPPPVAPPPPIAPVPPIVAPVPVVPVPVIPTPPVMPQPPVSPMPSVVPSPQPRTPEGPRRERSPGGRVPLPVPAGDRPLPRPTSTPANVPEVAVNPAFPSPLPLPAVADPAKAERRPLPTLPNPVVETPATPPENAAGPVDPGQVKVRDKVKTIRRKGQVVELREFTPEEKAQRKLVRNVVLLGTGLALLLLVYFFLLWLQ